MMVRTARVAGSTVKSAPQEANGGNSIPWSRACCTAAIMYVLARRKLDVARQLGSRAMRADAIESITCGWLSLVVVVGLVANFLLAAWWVDAVTSLGIVWFVVKEAREAWSGDDCCSDE